MLVTTGVSLRGYSGIDAAATMDPNRVSLPVEARSVYRKPSMVGDGLFTSPSSVGLGQ